MDTMNFYKVKLGDIADIYTAVTYVKNLDKIGQFPYIYIPKVFCAAQKTQFLWYENQTLLDGYGVMSKTKEIDMLYLYTILNSIGYQIYLNRGEYLKKVKLTIKQLKEVPIAIPSFQIQGVVSYLQLLIAQIAKVSRLDDFSYIQLRLFQEIRDSISVQLLVPDVLKNYDVDVLSKWIEFLVGFCQNREVSIEEAPRQLGKLLLQPANGVLNEVKKMRVVIRQINNSIIENVR